MGEHGKGADSLGNDGNLGRARTKGVGVTTVTSSLLGLCLINGGHSLPSDS